MLMRDTIYQALRRAILSCEFRPGQELREPALLPRQGYRVNPISISGAEDLFRLRLLIDPACARAAARADDEELRALDHFRGFADRSNSLFGLIEYYKSFHEAIAGLSGNKRMAEVARNLIEQSERLVRITVDVLKHEAVHRNAAEHQRFSMRMSRALNCLARRPSPICHMLWIC
jgi:DNA-binding GntR family transcriptional regulator